MIKIYSRPGCHLCDEMKAIVQRVAGRQTPPITMEIVDVSADPNLEALYGLEVPVLLVNGKKAAKYRVTEAELTRMLSARADGAGEAGKAGR